MNSLHYGDNLAVLRGLEAESVDLVYLDPPFQSGRDYSAVFEARDERGERAEAQAFTDTWRWGPDAERACAEVEAAGGPAARALAALRVLLGDTDMTAYLAMMAPRLVELRRVLRSTGSLYLHCDPTASHYLKLMLDAVFGAGCFRNEIIWRYRRWPAPSRRFQRMHDVLLFYTARPGTEHVFHTLYGYEKLAESTLKTFGTKKQRADFSSGHRKPSVEDAETAGPPLSDVWEVGIIAASGRERTGYPTQKPEALLERVILASTRPGDVVLDPFCGSGTTLAVAERLGRRWVGVDVTQLALNLARERMQASSFRVIGEPKDAEDLRRLASRDPAQLRYWTLGRLGAAPIGSKGAARSSGRARAPKASPAAPPSSTRIRRGVRRADPRSGADALEACGELRFDLASGDEGRAVVVVVAEASSGAVRALDEVRIREGADAALLVTFAPARGLVAEAAKSGAYASSFGSHPRLQLVAFEDVLAGASFDVPGRAITTTRRAG